MKVRRPRGAVHLTIVAIVAVLMSLLVPGASAAAPPGGYFNGFENAGDAVAPPSGSDEPMFDVTRVASGTNGVTSSAGAWHAEAAANDFGGPLSSFTRLGGYSSVFPVGGFTTSVDVYLDTGDSPIGSDLRFDLSSAINDAAGAHRRDFVFSVGTNGTGGFVMSASNNAPGWPANPGREPFTISESGWYTFRHVFRDVAGVLAVDMSVLTGTTVLHTWTLSDPSDQIGTTVGGNRYLWLIDSDFSSLALDNVTRTSAACTTVCYVDATSGNDAFGGGSPDNAKATIQAALNQVSAGGEVRVLPGTYDESAPGSTPTSLPGTYQFGLFFPSDKDGITLMGVTAADAEITAPNAVVATINTNATNNFGYSGIFVEAADTTIQGVEIGPNASGDNKTIEVVADNFTLKDVDTSIPNGGGSIYINDFSTNGDVVKSYHVLENLFDDGTSVDIASGAGNTGDVTGREIKDNVFDLMNNGFNAISFNGSGGVPWFVNPVGGAEITGNSFSNSTQYIRARGDYHEAEFDWESYWNDNGFPDGAVIDLISEDPPFDVQPFSYTSGAYTFTNVRRIGGTILGELDNAVDGNTVLVAAGTYPESPKIMKSVTLKSDDGAAATTIDLQTVPTYLGSLTIGGANTDVTVEGFTIEGRDAACPTLAASNIFLEGGPDAVSVLENVIKVGEVGECSNGDDGFGLLTTYNDSAVNVTSLTVDGNTFEPLGDASTGAFYINPGVDQFAFTNNDVLGEFGRTSITHAMDGSVEGNLVDGLGSSGAGLGTWGYPDADVFGHTTFSGNEFKDLGTALGIFETNEVTVDGNDIEDNETGVVVDEGFGASNFDPTSIRINHNNIVGNTHAGVENASTTAGTVDGTCNWWGSITGPTNASNPSGTGDDVIHAVDFEPWLVAATPGGTCIGGTWTFEGFFSPVDNDSTTVKAGRTVPLKWRILDADGNPVDDPSSFVSLKSVDCDGQEDIVDESGATVDGLVSQGDGYWQFNWITDPDYEGCRTLVLTLGDGSVQTAEFEFK